MTAPEDWNSFYQLVKGYKEANQFDTLYPHWYLRDRLAGHCIRVAGRCGRIDVILQCAQAPSKTGVVLTNFLVVRQLMWWIQWKAASGGWTAQGTAKALSQAEMLVNLMDEKVHYRKSLISLEDARSHREITGVLLELAVVQAKISGDQRDKEKVLVFTRRLLPNLEPNQKVRGLTKDVNSFFSADLGLRILSPILLGVRGALDILESSLPEAVLLKQKEVELTTELEGYRLVVSEDKRTESFVPTGQVTYQTLFGSKAEALESEKI